MKNFILQTIFFFKLAAVILLLFKAHHYERGRSCVGGGEGSENMEAKWPASRPSSRHWVTQINVREVGHTFYRLG